MTLERLKRVIFNCVIGLPLIWYDWLPLYTSLDFCALAPARSDDQSLALEQNVLSRLKDFTQQNPGHYWLKKPLMNQAKRDAPRNDTDRTMRCLRLIKTWPLDKVHAGSFIVLQLSADSMFRSSCAEAVDALGKVASCRFDWNTRCFDSGKSLHHLGSQVVCEFDVTINY